MRSRSGVTTTFGTDGFRLARNPAHAGSRVSRAGWYGTAPHRRQRWECHPLSGERPHRFTEVLTRQEAATSHCADCSSELDVWEGQSGARAYSFSARDIAHGLARVAQGDSYRRAAAHTRVVARREHNRVRYCRKKGVRRARHGDKTGGRELGRPVRAHRLLAVPSPDVAGADGRRLDEAGSGCPELLRPAGGATRHAAARRARR